MAEFDLPQSDGSELIINHSPVIDEEGTNLQGSALRTGFSQVHLTLASSQLYLTSGIGDEA